MHQQQATTIINNNQQPYEGNQYKNSNNQRGNMRYYGYSSLDETGSNCMTPNSNNLLNDADLQGSVPSTYDDNDDNLISTTDIISSSPVKVGDVVTLASHQHTFIDDEDQMIANNVINDIVIGDDCTDDVDVVNGLKNDSSVANGRLIINDDDYQDDDDLKTFMLSNDHEHGDQRLSHNHEDENMEDKNVDRYNTYTFNVDCNNHDSNREIYAEDYAQPSADRNKLYRNSNSHRSRDRSYSNDNKRQHKTRSSKRSTFNSSHSEQTKRSKRLSSATTNNSTSSDKEYDTYDDNRAELSNKNIEVERDKSSTPFRTNYKKTSSSSIAAQVNCKERQLLIL
jgi:hypothetical protein